MGLRDELQRAQQEALRGKQAEVLATLRVLWSSIRTEEINQRKELSDEEIVAVIARQVKQSHDALSDFTKGGRADLVAKTEQEIALLQSYLPKQMTDEEIRAVVSRVIASSGAVGAKDVGRVMGLAMKEMKGTADGNRVRGIVTELLTE